jgi:hypothetical protein
MDTAQQITAYAEFHPWLDGEGSRTEDSGTPGEEKDETSDNHRRPPSLLARRKRLLR